MSEPGAIDRRKLLKWVLCAAASAPLASTPLRRASAASGATIPAPGATTTPGAARGYGTDPDVMRIYHSGELWPLTLDAAQRRSAAALCDVIIPADAVSPSASAVGVVDFIDEWISAPYAEQQQDAPLIIEGLARLEAQAARQFGKRFADLAADQQRTLCDPLSYLATAQPEHRDGAVFFARFRDLTAGAFYTTPEGTRDLGFVGNMALSRFDGPPLEVLKKAGLA